MARMRDLLPLLGWLGSLVAGIVLFTQLGDGPLATPPLTEPGAWSAWAADRDGVVAALAVLRLVVLALAWYLVGVTSVGLVARLLRLARLVRIADAISGPVVRHVLRSAVGVSLAVGVVAASTGATQHTGGQRDDVATATAVTDGEDDDEVAQAVALDGAADVGGVAPTAVATSLEGPEVERMVGLPPALAGAADDAEGDDAADAVEEVADDRAQHEVVAGEHLWSIAASVVADELGRSPTDREVHAYWEVLVEDNRDRLADPQNPDLLFPGQELVLPDATRAPDA